MRVIRSYFFYNDRDVRRSVLYCFSTASLPLSLYKTTTMSLSTSLKLARIAADSGAPYVGNLAKVAVAIMELLEVRIYSLLYYLSPDSVLYRLRGGIKQPRRNSAKASPIPSLSSIHLLKCRGKLEKLISRRFVWR